MEYCTSLRFEEAADFNYLKHMVVTAAQEADLDLFDNVYDWTLLLCKQKLAGNANRPIDPVVLQRQMNQFRFHSYEDVKNIIYQAYSKKPVVRKPKEEEKK